MPRIKGRRVLMKRNFFLDHPVFSIVISIVVFIIGVIGLMLLPVDQYPQIVPPVVKVSASYPGADALTVTQAVATPIEQELNGTPGMIYMSSSSWDAAFSAWRGVIRSRSRFALLSCARALLSWARAFST